MHKLRLLTTALLIAAVTAVAIPMAAAEAQFPPFSPFECTVFVDSSPAGAGLPVQGYIGGVPKGIGGDPAYTGDLPGMADNECMLILDIGGADIGQVVTFTVDGESATTIPSPVYASQLPQAVQLTISYGPPAPTVTTQPASDITHNYARMHGTVVDLSGYPSVTLYFELDGVPNNWGTVTSPGSHWLGTSGLTPDTWYSYRACVEYDSLDICGAPESFKTDVGPDWPVDKNLVTGWNVISTPVWLDADFDTIGDIISGGYDLAYKWTGTAFANLPSSHVWKPLEAFYIKVSGTATATFVPFDGMKAPNKRVFTGNRWYLVGSSPDDGTSAQTMDIVLANLKDNYSNVIKPALNLNGSGDSCACNTLDPCTGLTLPAFGGAWVYVGPDITKTIVGFYGFTPVVP